MAPFKRLNTKLSKEWGVRMDNARDRIKLILDHFESNINDPLAQLALVNGIIDMLALPTRELVPLLGKNSKTGKVAVEFHNSFRPNFTLDLGDTQPTRATEPAAWAVKWHNLKIDDADLGTMLGKGQSDVHCANRAIHNDRLGMATKILTSNGTATRSSSSADVMARMHKSRIDPLRLPTPNGPQLRLDTQECYDKLKLEAGMKDAPFDLFGWSQSLHFFQRNRKKKKTHSCGRKRGYRPCSSTLISPQLSTFS
jgi:hypothetical protein